MKSTRFIFLILLSLLAFSCADDLTDFGSGVRPSSDDISLDADTFHLKSNTFLVDSVLSVPDSFLLGGYKNSKYGTIRADILTSFNSTEGFSLPEGAVADSLVLLMYRRSSSFDNNTALVLSVYELKKELEFGGRYYSNLKLDDYVDLSSTSLIDKTVKMSDNAGQNLATTPLRLNLGDNLMTSFYNRLKSYGTTGFSSFFKGLYVKSSMGLATLMNIYRLDLKMYYHYSRYNAYTGKMETLNSAFELYSNKEVGRVNRLTYDNAERTQLLSALPDTVNYVCGPANMNTQIVLPLNAIQTRMNQDVNYTEGRKQLLNVATLKLEVNQEDIKTDEGSGVAPSLAVDKPTYLLLVKEHFKTQFFTDGYVPTSNDTIALLGRLSTEYDTKAEKYKYYYEYNLAPMISQELKNAKDAGVATVPDLSLILMPVKVETTVSSSTAVVSAVRPLNTYRAITLRSARTVDGASQPMHLKLVYSIF